MSLAPTEFTQESVRQFMLAAGGRVTNHELVKNFKLWLTDPMGKDSARARFKDYVNTLATIKQENGEKYLILKKKFYPEYYSDTRNGYQDGSIYQEAAAAAVSHGFLDPYSQPPSSYNSPPVRHPQAYPSYQPSSYVSDGSPSLLDEVMAGFMPPSRSMGSRQLPSIPPQAMSSTPPAPVSHNSVGLPGAGGPHTMGLPAHTHEPYGRQESLRQQPSYEFQRQTSSSSTYGNGEQASYSPNSFNPHLNHQRSSVSSLASAGSYHSSPRSSYAAGSPYNSYAAPQSYPSRGSYAPVGGSPTRNIHEAGLPASRQPPPYRAPPVESLAPLPYKPPPPPPSDLGLPSVPNGNSKQQFVSADYGLPVSNHNNHYPSMPPVHSESGPPPPPKRSLPEIPHQPPPLPRRPPPDHQPPPRTVPPQSLPLPSRPVQNSHQENGAAYPSTLQPSPTDSGFQTATELSRDSPPPLRPTSLSKSYGNLNFEDKENSLPTQKPNSASLDNLDSIENEKISVKERTKTFNRMASETELPSQGGTGRFSSTVKRRNSRAVDMISSRRSSARGGDEESNDSASITTIDPTIKSWMVLTAKGDYQGAAKMLMDEPKLARHKDFTTGYTALHWAAKHGNTDLVKLLAGTYQANVNARSNGGYTPLHIAAQQGHQDVFDLLVQAYRADAHIRDYAGKKPRQYMIVTDTAGIGLSLSNDTFRQLKDRRKNRTRKDEKNPGILRFGSLSVKVKKTTEAFNNYFGGGSEVNHKRWGAAADPNSDSVKMPPPKFAPIKKRKSKRTMDFGRTKSAPVTPTDRSPIKDTIPEGLEDGGGQAGSDSDSEYGFGNTWNGQSHA